MQQAVCPKCHGEGKQAKTPCHTCKGEGRELKTRTLEIEIPAGIDDGQTIRVSGKGEAPAGGGEPGDLFATIHVQPHKVMKRRGDDVTSTVAVSFIDAIIGTKIKIDTLNGKQEITVPAGTQPGQTITLDEEGFRRLQRSGHGDHVVTIKVQIPKKISRKQEKLLKEFEVSGKKGLFNF